MKLKVVTGIVLTLFLVGMLSLAFNIQLVKASGTITINEDGSVDPPTAPIFSADNVTYTFTGNINDSIVVLRSHIIIDGAGYTLNGTGTGEGKVVSHTYSSPGTYTVTLTVEDNGGLTDQSSLQVAPTPTPTPATGVLHDPIRIEGNGDFTAENGVVGGSGTAEDPYIIEDWDIDASTAEGIFILGCDAHFIIRNVSVHDGGMRYHGILLINTVNGVVEESHITNNGGGIRISNSPVEEDDPRGNTIRGNTVSNNNVGIFLESSGNNILRGNILTNNTFNFGVIATLPRFWLNSVDASNTVDGRPLYYWVNQGDGTIPADAGYVLAVNCRNITVRGSTLQNNLAGIMFVNTINSTIEGVDASRNQFGIYLLFGSNDNMISGNTVANNEYGIYLDISKDNTINGNTISDNEIGIHVSDIKDTRTSVYHNNIIDNEVQAWEMYSQGPSNNKWDNGYPSGGNYWSDYTGEDANGDGIGDTPYVIVGYGDANNRDSYPLMGPFNTFDAGTWNGVTYNVDVVSNSSVSDFYFNPDEGPFIRFNVTGLDGIKGFSRVAIPKQLLWVEEGQWVVLVGGEPVVPTVTEDADYTYLYFTYSHSTKTVQIIGTHVIPEFPTWTSMLLILIVLTVATAIHKQRLLKTPIH